MGNPVPAWANASNTTWGLTSFGANWQVFKDKGTSIVAIRDGSSNTIIFADKYAVAKRSNGVPWVGASLWGYGSDPHSDDYTQLFPEQSLYYTGYWPRIGFVNKIGPFPGSWPDSQPWNHRCMRKPEFAPPLDNVHPMKSQGFTPSGISVCMADGSVRFVSSSVSDRSWCIMEGPNDGEINQIDP